MPVKPKDPIIAGPSDDEWKDKISTARKKKTAEEKITVEDKPTVPDLAVEIASPEALPAAVKAEVDSDLTKELFFKDNTEETKSEDDVELLDEEDVGVDTTYIRKSMRPMYVINFSKEDSDLRVEVESAYKRSGEPSQFKKLTQDPNSLLYTLLTETEEQFNQLCYSNTTHAQEVADSVQALVDAKQTLVPQDKSLISRGPATAQGNTSLNGNRALMMTIARIQGIKRVYLYNSGFHVTIRPCSLGELGMLLNTINLEKNEFGNIYGGFSYGAIDLNIKKRFMEVFESLVVETNLKGYETSGTLAKAVSINDYDTLVWAVLSMINREGCEIRYACVNAECDFLENINVDLNRIRFNCMERLPKEASEILMSDKQITLADTVKYREQILSQNKILKVTNKDTNSNTVITTEFFMVPPSIAEVITTSDALLSKLFGMVSGDHSYRNEELSRLYGMNLSWMIHPWVKQLRTTVNDAPDFSTNNEEAIITAIDNVYSRKFNEMFVKYLQNNQITFYCMPCLKCPKCGKVPGRTIEDYYPIDVNQLFFSLCSLRLMQEI